ncbi:MAG: hypothetical protein LBU90_08090 [Bacteroidales bacterium]|jgi:hypothetical protein|nr:hypothetical protein [Bacteroidales bacterium]
MNTKILYSFIIGVLCAASLMAQSQPDSPELNKSIKVYSEYKPQVADAQRLTVNPTAYDTVKVPVELHYSFDAAPIEVTSELHTLRAVSVKGDKLRDLFRGYATVGGGNYATFMAQAGFMSERSRQYQNGIEFSHRSSAGKIRFEDNTKYPANYQFTNLSLYTKRFFTHQTLSAGITPSLNSYLKYGRNVVTPTELTEWLATAAKKDYRRTQFSNRTYAGLQSNTANAYRFQYNTNVAHTITAINPRLAENSLQLRAQGRQNVGEMYIGGEFETAWNGVNFTPSDTLIRRNTTQISLRPYLFKQIEIFDFELGLLVQQTFDGNSAFKPYPQARFSARLWQQSVTPYIAYKGYYKQHSMLEMLNENPYAADSTLLQASDFPIDAQLGIQGRVAQILPFHAYAQFKRFKNEHFWVNSFANNQENTFLPVYDNGNLIRLHGEFGVSQKVLSALAQLSYNHYALKTEEFAWHKPEVEAQIDVKWNIQNPLTGNNKLIVTSQFFAYGNIYAQLPHYVFPDSWETIDAISETPTYKKLPNIIDFNLHLDYYYNTALLIFCHVNNITATRYQQFYLYPSQRTNFLLGVSYSFGNKKQ